MSNRPSIVHLYADVGIEDEVLAAYGDVTRVGIDPKPNPFSEVVRADARTPPLKTNAFDLAVVHHPCGRWSPATENGGGDPDEWPDDLDRARQVADRLADHWILENVPNAPLRDPVVLTGDDFGKPILYARAFETTFPIEPPSGRAHFRPDFGSLAEQGTTGKQWVGEAISWRNAKGYSHEWPSRDLKRHAVPRPYLEHLLYHWLATRHGDRGRSEQTTLLAATDGGESA